MIHSLVTEEGKETINCSALYSFRVDSLSVLYDQAASLPCCGNAKCSLLLDALFMLPCFVATPSIFQASTYLCRMLFGDYLGSVRDKPLRVIKKTLYG